MKKGWYERIAEIFSSIFSRIRHNNYDHIYKFISVKTGPFYISLNNIYIK